MRPAKLACVRNRSWREGGGGLIGFLWQYWEPGIRGKEIEVKTLERMRESGNSGYEGDEGFALHSVLPCSATDTQLCPNSFKGPPSLLGL